MPESDGGIVSLFQLETFSQQGQYNLFHQRLFGPDTVDSVLLGDHRATMLLLRRHLSQPTGWQQASLLLDGAEKRRKCLK
jgi:hypothetical protein